MRLIFLALFLLVTCSTFAQQNDTLQTDPETDTDVQAEVEPDGDINVEPEAAVTEDDTIDNERTYSPSKAALLSAVVPGLGQAYNKKYWKIPIIYAGGGVLFYFIRSYNQDYQYFRDLYRTKSEYAQNPTGTPPIPQYSLEELELERDFYRRNRDLNIIIAALVYGLQIVDAAVDAHLKEFEINDDLSMGINPSYKSGPGLAVTLSFK